MTISREEAASVLRLLAGAFPTPAIDEDTARAYLDRMTSSPFTDVAVLLATAEACVDTLDRLPTLHQLLIAYQAAARAKIAEDHAALDRAGRARTSLPQPDERFGREMVDVLRTALSENLPSAGADGARGHAHMPGVDPLVGVPVPVLADDGSTVTRAMGQCPVCSQAEATTEKVRARVGQLLVARHIVARPQPVTTYRCRDCQDRGVVEVDGPDGQMTVRPCPRCREDQYEAWAAGKLALRRGW